MPAPQTKPPTPKSAAPVAPAETANVDEVVDETVDLGDLGQGDQLADPADEDGDATLDISDAGPQRSIVLLVRGPHGEAGERVRIAQAEAEVLTSIRAARPAVKADFGL